MVEPADQSLTVVTNIVVQYFCQQWAVATGAALERANHLTATDSIHVSAHITGLGRVNPDQQEQSN